MLASCYLCNETVLCVCDVDLVGRATVECFLYCVVYTVSLSYWPGRVNGRKFEGQIAPKQNMSAHMKRFLCRETHTRPTNDSMLTSALKCHSLARFG